MSFNFFVPTNALFGVGQLNSLHEQKLPGKKAMIVISNGKSTIKNGYLVRTEEQLHMAGIETVVFNKVQANPLKSTVETGAKFARDNNVDFIVALGGGSVIDASKSISAMANNDGDLWDYVCAGTGRGKSFPNKFLPLVAITTTAGTGSETDYGSVITNPDTHEKIGIISREFPPVLSIIDPELMTSVPPKFTAYQGFDAFFHSAEGYISNKANLMSDMVGITSVESVSRFLPRACKDGSDIEAREKVAFGNYLSGMMMCVGSLTSQHALEHAMSAFHQELPHGAGLIMLSRAYFSFIINKHVCDDRFVRMARVMGREDASDPMDFISMLVKLQEDCGVADLKMSDYGITPDEFETFAVNAMDTMGRMFKCDRVDITVPDRIEIYKESYK